jgi:nucleotide-binding universal stress UspA family protein
MTLSSIAVHLDHSECCEARTRFAARLATVHGSHLCGIVPTGVRARTARQPPDATVTDTAAAVSASLYLRRRAETVAQVFRCRLRGLGSASFDACLVDGRPIDAVVAHARASDLLIVGQADAGAALDEAARRLYEEAMLHAGGPVLILPRAGRFDAAVDRVMIAWDGGREAAMSVRGALPLLREASQVTLVSLRHGNAPASTRVPPETRRWLQRHGVAAVIDERAAASVADTLLERASALDANLIVMGGYGHARARERILGGTTRELLARSWLPLCMTH